MERDQRHVYITVNSQDDAQLNQPQASVGTGVVYTRWGKSSCPAVEGTQLVYAGRAGGTHHTATGGASNYVCLPDNPQYLSYQSGVQGYSAIYGIELDTFSQPLSSSLDHNVACAVCYVSNRSVQLMIPARYECPTGWTREYYGYLMSEGSKWGGRHSTMFECVDKDPDAVPGENANTNPAVMYHVEAVCNGIDCPPYHAEKELTCVVCTK